MWRNRIVRYGEENPDQLLANPRNWRIHPACQQDVMKETLEELGWIQDIIVNETTGAVLDGHMRITLALRHNEPSVPVKYVRLTEEEEAVAISVFDQIGRLAVADKEKLDALLAEIQNTPKGDSLRALMEDIRNEYGIPDCETATGEGTRGLGIDPVIQYAIIFDTEDQQQDFFRLVRHLKTTYVEQETLGARLSAFIQDQLADVAV